MNFLGSLLQQSFVSHVYANILVPILVGFRSLRTSRSDSRDLRGVVIINLLLINLGTLQPCGVTPLVLSLLYLLSLSLDRGGQEVDVSLSAGLL